MGDTFYLEKLGLSGIGQRSQGCAYRMSKFPFPYAPQDLPLSTQSSRKICSWPCGRRIFSLRMEVFPSLSYRVPAMLLRTPLPPPANCRAPFPAFPPSSCHLCFLIRQFWVIGVIWIRREGDFATVGKNVSGPGHGKKDFSPTLSKFCPEGPSADTGNRTGIFPSGGQRN